MTLETLNIGPFSVVAPFACVCTAKIAFHKSKLLLCTPVCSICDFMQLLIFPLAVCLEGCYNGGTCIRPGVCSCTTGWTAQKCRKGEYNLNHV